jgi:hypothetical protein
MVRYLLQVIAQYHMYYSTVHVGKCHMSQNDNCYEMVHVTKQNSEEMVRF